MTKQDPEQRACQTNFGAEDSIATWQLLHEIAGLHFRYSDVPQWTLFSVSDPAHDEVSG